MGKIRVNTIGDAEQEKKQAEKAEKRKLAKEQKDAEKQSAESKDNKSAGVTQEEGIPTTRTEQSEGVLAGGKPGAGPQAEGKSKEENKKKQKKGKKHYRGKKYTASKQLVDRSKTYSLVDALDLLEKTKFSNFDETVELHINTLTGGVSGIMTLPHGTGKQTRVAILAPSKDAKAADDLLKEIESGKISFDILVATPDAMPKLAKVARILGPRGLMPNPKNGTITPKPEDVAEKYKGGQMAFKTEAKAPILHLVVGKMSFGKTKLSENINTAFSAVKLSNIKNATLKSTMSPGIKLQVVK